MFLVQIGSEMIFNKLGGREVLLWALSSNLSLTAVVAPGWLTTATDGKGVLWIKLVWLWRRELEALAFVILRCVSLCRIRIKVWAHEVLGTFDTRERAGFLLRLLSNGRIIFLLLIDRGWHLQFVGPEYLFKEIDLAVRSACEAQRNNSELERLCKFVHLIKILREAYGETVKAKRNLLLRHNGYDAILTAVGNDQRHNEANKCIELQSCLLGVVTVVVTLRQELN